MCNLPHAGNLSVPQKRSALLIFNAVVDGNDRAIRLYEKLGFQHVSRIPGGFLLKTGVYQDIFVYYHTLSAAEGI